MIILEGQGKLMKKLFLAVILFCLIFAVTACKNDSSESNVSADTGKSVESMHAEETLELDLEDGQEGEIAPD